MSDTGRAPDLAATKAEERRVFILLAVFLAPIISVVLVGGYGFAIWISQLIFGPPAY